MSDHDWASTLCLVPPIRDGYWYYDMSACLLGSVHPVLRLRVIRIVDLLWRVESRLKVLEQTAALLALTVNEHIIPVSSR